MEKYYGLIIIVCFMVYILLILFIVHKHEIKLQENTYKHELHMQKLKGEIKYEIKFQESKEIRGISN